MDEKHKQEMQDLLNRSVQHIRQQGKPSLRHPDRPDDRQCVYRSPLGLSCAAAPFIVDYDARMDDGDLAGSWSKSFTGNWERHLDPLAVKHQNFVRKLQRCHDLAADDRSRFLERYEENIADLAIEFGLDVPAAAAA